MREEELTRLGLTQEQAARVLELHIGEEQAAGERLETLRQSWQEDTARLKLENAVERELWKSGAKSIRALRGMLDIGALHLEDNGTVGGLEEQLAALRQSDSYLFASEGGAPRMSSGTSHGGTSVPEFDRMNDEEYYAAKLGSR